MKSNPLKSILKMAASQIRVDIYQRLMAYAIFNSAFKELASVPHFYTREQLWTECISNVAGSQNAITYIEFGVYQGASITRIAAINENPDSIFIGLDSFEGLPEPWNPHHQRGAFNPKGEIPNIDDARVSFIKGWFQDTWDSLCPRIPRQNDLIVHYDADLYSSTLFALTKIDTLKKPYIAIFDEFIGHETRALYDYLQSYSATISFLGQVPYMGYPMQVMSRITPHG